MIHGSSKEISMLLSSLLPSDIALKIASSLEVRDLCALGCCSRFWREICGSDCVWESLSRARWSFLGSSAESAPVRKTLELYPNSDPNLKEWREFYMEQQNDFAEKAITIINNVKRGSQYGSLDIKHYLKAIEDLSSMQFEFKDVQMFFFRPQLTVLVNLIGLHYCINWLKVPSEQLMEALVSSKILEKHVGVTWWKLGRWSNGFRMRDETHTCWVSLKDLAMRKEEEVLGMLCRGAVHEVLLVSVFISSPAHTLWY